MVPVQDPLEFAFAQTWIQIAENDPKLREEELLPLVKQVLTEKGLSMEQIDSFTNFFRERPIILRRGAILNPRFLRRKARKRLHFLMVDARYASYHHLREIIGRTEGELSHYSLYGPADRLLKLWSTLKETEELLELLQRSGFDPDHIRVEDTYRFYGYDLASDEIPRFDNLLVTRDVINSLVEDYWDPAVEDATRQQLESQKVVLGPTLVEDLRVTGRIRAYVGINFVRSVPTHIARDYSTHLNEKGELVRKVIRSIFRCDGISFDYLLMLMCNNPIELDIVTEQLNEQFSGGSGIESSTFIVAEANEELPKYVTGRSVIVDVSTQLRDEHAAYLRQIEQNHIEPLAQRLRDAYLRSSREKRLYILQAIDSFEQRPLDQFGFVNETEFTRDFVSSYVRAYLGHSINQMVGTATTLGNAIEIASKQTLKEALTWFFPAHNLAMAQNDLGLSGGNPDKFMLGKVEDAFEKIKKDKRYQQLGLQLDDFFMQEFKSFRIFRNRAAHSALKGLMQEDFETGSQQIRDAYRQGYWLLQQFQRKVFEPDYLPRALQIVLEQQEVDDETRQLRETLVKNITDSTERIIARLAALEKRERKRIHALMMQVSKLDRSVKSQQQQQQELLNWFQTHREEIEENSVPGERNRVEQLMGVLQEQGKVLPGNVLAEVIAGVLVGLSQPYLSEVLPQILHYMR